jgi:hypothetical protein
MRGGSRIGSTELLSRAFFELSPSEVATTSV